MKHYKGHYKKNDIKYQTIKAAKDLLYGPEVIRKLENAETDSELTRIMVQARHDQIKESEESK